MKRALLAVVLVVVAGCEKNREPVEKLPTPSPGATAPPPPVDARPAADLVVEIDRVAVGAQVIPDRDGAVDRAALEAALAGRTGDQTMAVARDASYQRVVDVMDVAVKLGLDVAIDTGGGATSSGAGAMPPLGDPDNPTLVITISTQDILLGGKVVTSLADLPAGGEIPALRDALAALAATPAVVAIQADRRTSGDVLVRVIDTARRAGVGHVAFAVDRAGTPPPRFPRKP